MSGYTEGSNSARNEDALVDQPDTLAGGEFTEELEGATEEADSRDAAAEAPDGDIESDKPTQVADPDLSSDEQDAQAES